MRLLFVVCLLHSVRLVAQTETEGRRMYTLEEARIAHPDTIEAITLSKLKLDSVPSELRRYSHLIVLDLSKNNLRELPDFIGDFPELQHLNIEKHQLIYFPTAICRLTNLKTVILNRNEFSSIPDCIGYCSSLVYLDLWDTPVYGFPESLSKLPNLEKMDIQGVKYGPTFQENLRKMLPNVQLLMDVPCDCME